MSGETKPESRAATIMMVDDEPTTLEIVEVFLQGEGYTKFITTSDSTKALDLFAQKRPDVLLLDLKMPKVSGLEILAEIRKQKAHKHTPIIILTSASDSQTKLKALSLGATDFLAKPVDAPELSLRLRNALTAKAHRDRLAHYQSHLERKVRERTSELNLMRIAAERASDAKSHFLTNMSHEIRTPMTAIRGYTDVLIEDQRIEGDQRENLDIIRRNADHLIALINGILDLSKIESGHMEIEQVPVDPVELMVEVARAMQVRADERGLDLRVEFPTPLPTCVLSDPVRVRQSIVNLVGNAIKFTQKGSVLIRLGYDELTWMARVDVIDTGIGVPADRIRSIFKQFEQADASTSREFGGTGLGLAITRRLANLLGGDCTMESEVGRGSTVSFTFQAKLEENAEIRLVPAEARRLRQDSASAEAPSAPLEARILLAEDGLDNQRLISMLLRKAGAEVEIAENGQVAVDAVRGDDSLDLVLMDMAMPQMDGYTATTTLREMGFEIPIVALTAHALEGERDKCLAAGCDDYATKPIDKALLISTVRGAIEKRAAGVPAQQPAPQIKPVVKRTTRTTADDELEEEAHPLPESTAAALEDYRGATIMMVDDEPTTLDVIEMFLQGEGYTRFARTSDPREALSLMADKRPDVVLLDLVMPEVGGLDVLLQMRQEEAFRRTPVIILTSSTDAETKLKALELGASDFLSKPVDASELALRLRNTLAAKAYQDRLTYYDSLTGLPNRRLFLERLGRTLLRVGQEGARCSVLHININRFKQINDTLGHEAGDELLTAVAERLQDAVRDPLARIGGDEFSLLLPRAGSADEGGQVAQQIVVALENPFCIGGQDLFVTCSIGIALYPDDGEDMESLLKNANAATTHAKQEGQSPYQFYRKSLNAESVERLSLESALRGALYCDEIVLHYQPKVDMVGGRVIAAEALMRWKHPELGLLLPGSFIPIAEESDLIESLDDWALGEACQQSKQWLAQGFRPTPIGVNISSRQFRSGKLVEAVSGALEQNGLDAEHLILELSERQLMENPHRTLLMLRELKEMGIRLTVNGFGTGESSLSHLKRLPLDELKIDPSFMAGIPDDPDDRAIVSAIIGLAHNLGLQVTAVGVETEAQLEFLKERDCDIYQGRLFGRPVPPAKWPELVDKKKD